MLVTFTNESSHLYGCDREPIHIPGTIQPHGVLLVLDEDQRVLQCSANVREYLGMDIEQALGSTLDAVLRVERASLVPRTVAREKLENTPLLLETILVNGKWFDLVFHKRHELTIAELEANDSDGGSLLSRLYPAISKSLATLGQQLSLPELLQIGANEIRKLTNFDRVLIYQFGPDWAGTVVAESRNDKLPSYMDLRFPESDIPRQARELYRLNRVRLIADAYYTPVPIVPTDNPLTGRTLDLTYSMLRSVSPVHLEYMKNMGTVASMSVSIIRDGQLWGLIACHHHTAAHVPAQVRVACELTAQVLSSQIAAAVEHASAVRRAELVSSQRALLTHLSASDSIVDGIKANPRDMLLSAGAEGAAVLFEDRCEVIGRTPSPSQIQELGAWISQQQETDVFVTSELSRVFPQSISYRQIASGVLAVSISEFGIGYLFWFRPEKSAEVKWAGNPNKIEVAIDGRIHPRQSFQTWTEREQGHSQTWEAAEVESAVAFRGAVVNLVLKKAQKLAALSADLQRSNSELEAFSYSVSHDLRAPFRHIVGYAEIMREDESITGENRRYLDTIVESANFGGLLVDNLLSFARLGKSKLDLGPVSMKRLAQESMQSAISQNPGRNIHWEISELPEVTADAFLLRLAIENLVANAVKYTRPRATAKIEIGAMPERVEQCVMFIRDNGVGFDMQFGDKLFGVFQRLHRAEEFEGTGIGLATVRQIISRHGGKTWAHGEVGRGATFFISLPLSSPPNGAL